MARRPTIVNVPMRSGERLRFAVHADGTCYELRKAGQLKVHDELMRRRLVAFTKEGKKTT